MKKLLVFVLLFTFFSCTPDEPQKYDTGDIITLSDNENSIWIVRSIAYGEWAFSAKTRKYRLFCRNIHTGRSAYFYQSQVKNYTGDISKVGYSNSPAVTNNSCSTNSSCSKCN